MIKSNPATCELCRRHLEADGFRVHITKGGRQAVDTIRRLLPDIVLLDLMMPDMDGFRMLEQLKADPVTREVPILILADRDETPVVAKALRLGADDFLKKPFDDEELLVRVKKIISSEEIWDSLHNATEELLKSQLNIIVTLKEWEQEAEAFKKHCETIIINLLTDPEVSFPQKQAMPTAEQARDLLNRIVDRYRLRRTEYDVLH
ncbi:MAG: response regulator [Thermodesulfobacteriota bacterium]